MTFLQAYDKYAAARRASLSVRKQPVDCRTESNTGHGTEKRQQILFLRAHISPIVLPLKGAQTDALGTCMLTVTLGLRRLRVVRLGLRSPKCYRLYFA